jgi:hypothetical protein
LALPDYFFIKNRRRRKRLDLFFSERLHKRLRIDLTINGCEFEAPSVFSRQFTNDLDSPLQMGPPSSVSSRTDNRGYTGTQRFAQNKPKISFYSLAWSTRISGAEIIWAGIGAAPIAAYKVRSLLYRADEAFVPKSGAKIPGGGNGFYLFSQLFSTAFRLVIAAVSVDPAFAQLYNINKT